MELQRSKTMENRYIKKSYTTISYYLLKSDVIRERT